jgi:hypothetical protein
MVTWEFGNKMNVLAEPVAAPVATKLAHSACATAALEPHPTCTGTDPTFVRTALLPELVVKPDELVVWTAVEAATVTAMAWTGPVGRKGADTLIGHTSAVRFLPLFSGWYHNAQKIGLLSSEN